MTREEMMNYLVSREGLEAEATVWFFELCEEYPNATDEKLYGVFTALLDLIQYVAELEEGCVE